MSLIDNWGYWAMLNEKDEYPIMNTEYPMMKWAVALIRGRSWIVTPSSRGTRDLFKQHRDSDSGNSLLDIGYSICYVSVLDIEYSKNRFFGAIVKYHSIMGPFARLRAGA